MKDEQRCYAKNPTTKSKCIYYIGHGSMHKGLTKKGVIFWDAMGWDKLPETKKTVFWYP